MWRRRERSALEARRSLWWPRPLDVDLLNENAEALLGEHDFRAFTPTEADVAAARATQKNRREVFRTYDSGSRT